MSVSRSGRPRAIYVSAVQIGIPGVTGCLEEAGLDVVAVCEDTGAGLTAIEDQQPDLVVIGALSPEEEPDGQFALCRWIIARWPGTQVILLRRRIEDIDQVDAAAVGASACLPLDISLEALTGEIARIMTRGPKPVDLVQISAFAAERLTPRQFQVLRLAAKGKTAREAARDLDNRLETVRSHEKAIRTKLKATSISDAVKRARRLGIV